MIAIASPGVTRYDAMSTFLPFTSHVAVVDELAGLGARAGEAEPVDDVVQTALEQRQQLLAGDALRARLALST